MRKSRGFVHFLVAESYRDEAAAEGSDAKRNTSFERLMRIFPCEHAISK
jgi:hypothetical protein